METMRIETSLRHRDQIPVLDVVGEIDIYTTPQFKEAVSAAINENKPAIIINMTNVTYMDSSGFRDAFYPRRSACGHWTALCIFPAATTLFSECCKLLD